MRCNAWFWASLIPSLFLSLSSAQAQGADAGSAVPPLPAEIPATATLYTILRGGKAAGQQAIWTTADGNLHVFYQYNDRGRGPSMTSVLTFARDGTPTAETLLGNNYLKSSIHEAFTRVGQRATWSNDAEHGEKLTAGPAFYIALNGAPAELGLLAHAALINGGHLGLLPEGETRLQRIAETDIQAGPKRQHVRLYALTGLDFSPTYVWLDMQEQYFGSSMGRIAIVPDGWEAAAPEMQEIQRRAIEARGAELAKKLAHHPAHGVVFVHANVFDANSASIVSNQTVVVVGNHIHAVGPAAEVTAPPDAETVDATGKTLLPGLWDMHAHVADNDGLLNLAAGITSVRDLANDTDAILARRKRIDAGTELGTRIILAGIIDGPGPFQNSTKVLVSTEVEARAAVDSYAGLGYVQIKIYSSLKPELVPAIIDEAHHKGLRVSGHIPAFMTAAECVRLGFDEVQHVNFLVLNFFPEVKETQTPARLTEPGKLAADLDLHSAEVQAFIRLLQVRHTTLDPTLAAFERLLVARPGELPPGYASVDRRLPPQVRRGLRAGGLTPPEGQEATYRRSFAKMVEFVGLLYRAGIPIEAGTDNLAAFTLERELELDVQAGIPPAKVLQLATLGAAKIMSRDLELGSVTAGKLADLVLVDGNPTLNISHVRKTALTLKDGVIYMPAELYSELGVQP
jgi:imidazolonepropionase-like amidohydrolase